MNSIPTGDPSSGSSFVAATMSPPDHSLAKGAGAVAEAYQEPQCGFIAAYRCRASCDGHYGPLRSPQKEGSYRLSDAEGAFRPGALLKRKKPREVLSRVAFEVGNRADG